MRLIAYETGIKPSEFWELTPAEFSSWLEGRSRAHRRDQELAAWVCANIMNCWSGKGHRITPSKLLGPKGGVIDANDFTSSEDFNRCVEEALS